jgi:hypothetical protein
MFDLYELDEAVTALIGDAPIQVEARRSGPGMKEVTVVLSWHYNGEIKTFAVTGTTSYPVGWFLGLVCTGLCALSQEGHIPETFELGGS